MLNEHKFRQVQQSDALVCLWHGQKDDNHFLLHHPHFHLMCQNLSGQLSVIFSFMFLIILCFLFVITLLGAVLKSSYLHLNHLAYHHYFLNISLGFHKPVSFVFKPICFADALGVGVFPLRTPGGDFFFFLLV